MQGAKTGRAARSTDRGASGAAGGVTARRGRREGARRRRRRSQRTAGRGPPERPGDQAGQPRRRVGATGPGEGVAALSQEAGCRGRLQPRARGPVLAPRRWYRRGRGKAGPGCRRTKWRRLMAACPPPPPLRARRRRRGRPRRSRAGKRRKHSARPDSPGRVRGDPGPEPRGSPGWDGGGAGADGGGWRRVRLLPSPSLPPRQGSE